MKLKILAIFLLCLAVLNSSFCAGQMKPNITASEIQKLERNYQNQRYTIETLRKNMDLIKKTLKELERTIIILESRVNKNITDVQQIKELKKDVVILRKLLIEFKNRYLR